MTISNSHVLNCRVNAPGLWPLTISLGANPSILLQLGGGLYSKASPLASQSKFASNLMVARHG
jgi:hypothetical protein